MIYIFGSRLYGKVDQVPGMFHIATKFGHLNFVPLIPMETYVVISTQGDQFTGVRIPMSGKSIVVAWGRAISIVAAAVGLIAALVMFSGPRPGEEAALFLGLGGFGAALAAFLWFYKGVTHASFERACQIGQLIGLTERGMQEVCRAYGQPLPRGFDVAPAAPPYQQGGYDPNVHTAQGYGQHGYPQQGYPPAGYPQQQQQPYPVAPAYPTYPAAPYPQVPAPAAPAAVPGTFFVTGVNRTNGETACVTIWADTPDAARAIGQSRGIDVRQVEYGGPR